MGDENKGKEGEGQEKLLPQSQVDVIVQDRLAREKAKYADYEDLKKFKTEHEKAQDAQQLKLLEEQKKYEEALKIHNTKLGDLQGLVSKKDAEIQDMKISNALIGEITKQNAYADEAMALLKNTTAIDETGIVYIKGRDANGLDVKHSVEEGVKKFLESRPHLVKATNRSGGGTPSANGAGAGAGQPDVATLSAEIASALTRGDHKKASELTKKLKSSLTSQG